MIVKTNQGEWQLGLPWASPPSDREVASRKAFRKAVFSDCERYRTRLIIQWDPRLSMVLFFMLNPSTADHLVNDPTVRRCIGFANRWGHGGLEVRNLFSLRSTSPSDLKLAADPIGPMDIVYDDDSFGMVIAAWGNHGMYRGRAYVVEREFYRRGIKLYHLGLTRDQNPRHPLYLQREVTPEILDSDRKFKKGDSI